MQKSIEIRKYLEERKEQNWLETASPFLRNKHVPREIQSPQIKKGYIEPNPLSKRQLKKRRKKERRLLKMGKYLPVIEKKRSPKSEHRRYIKSREWKLRRSLFYKMFGRECFACGSKKKLNVHHKSYLNLRNEQDEDLAVLCEDCHNEYHKLNGVQADMKEKTDRFITMKRVRVAGSTSERS